MTFWQSVLAFLDSSMETPTTFGWFHLLWLALSFLVLIPLLRFPKEQSPDHVRRVVLTTAIIVIILEVYKMINFSFSYENGIVFDFQWYAFPFQFCSTPMYIGLLAGLTKKGKVHESLCAYLATYAMFAGLAVMIYPNDVFVETIGINIQTMICHGSMITIAIYLFATGHVKLQHKTILKAMPVFAVTVGMAAIMNEIAYQVGLLETETFNMFYISPYCDPHLLIYADVQKVVPFPWSLVIYIVGFTAAAYLILLIAMGIGALVKKLRPAPVAVN
jgi:hypothetical protein